MDANLIKELKQVTGGSDRAGWMCDGVCSLLYALVQFYRPELVIQTGHLWGKSALVILMALTDPLLASEPECDRGTDENPRKYELEHFPLPCRGKLISIDPVLDDSGVKWLRAHYDNVEIERIRSQEWFDQHASLYKGLRVMGVVDGDHEPEPCRADLEGLAIMQAGLIFVDDTSLIQHIERVAREFAAVHNYGFVNLPWYNGVGILAKES